MSKSSERKFFMKQVFDLFKKLPASVRRRLREDRQFRMYEEFTKELCAHSIAEQIEADCEYTHLENDVLSKKLSKNNTQMILLSRENFRLLGEALEKVPKQYWGMTTVLPAEEIINGYEDYKKNPPLIRKKQLSLDVQQRIISFALDNMLWGINTIVYALNNIGVSATYCQVRTVLKRNHIPMSHERMKLGVSWNHFLESLKINLEIGVIIK